MTFKKNEIEFESDKVKAYVQQIQAENALLRQADEEKNELLIKLGCPTKATAKRKVLCLQQQLDQLKRQHESDKGLITVTGKMNYELLQEYDKLKAENDNIKETFDGLFKVQYKLADNNKKLRQCITEIKEIAKKQCVCGVDCIDMKQILQKISECEEQDA